MLTGLKPIGFVLEDPRKSEHFRGADGDAAGRVHRGGLLHSAAVKSIMIASGNHSVINRLLEAPPLCRFLWLLSCSETRK